MEYTVTITETLAKAIVVLADSPEEAEDYVQRLYEEGEIVLDGSDYEGAEPLETVESNSGTEPDYDIRSDKDKNRSPCANAKGNDTLCP